MSRPSPAAPRKVLLLRTIQELCTGPADLLDLQTQRTAWLNASDSELDDLALDLRSRLSRIAAAMGLSCMLCAGLAFLTMCYVAPQGAPWHFGVSLGVTALAGAVTYALWELYGLRVCQLESLAMLDGDATECHQAYSLVRREARAAQHRDEVLAAGRALRKLDVLVMRWTAELAEHSRKLALLRGQA